MLEHYLGGNDGSPNLWQDLGHGAPTLYALARVCSDALARDGGDPPELSVEARAILYLARARGVFELQAVNTAANALDRLLTVFVEVNDDTRVALKVVGNPESTARLFDGFRELCRSGLVMHHLYGEFSLTAQGFTEAKKTEAETLEDVLQQLDLQSAGNGL